MFIGCFFVKGAYARSDFVVKAVLSRKGWFTPPFQTKDEALAVLKKHYSSVEVNNERAMLGFRCIK